MTNTTSSRDTFPVSGGHARLDTDPGGRCEATGKVQRAESRQQGVASPGRVSAASLLIIA